MFTPSCRLLATMRLIVPCPAQLRQLAPGLLIDIMSQTTL